jgi:serine/threonine protein kinase
MEERLGSGGMGDVYRARHVQFGRLRAVKVIRQHFVDSGHREVIRRFYQEIKAVGALEHPNIVVAIDSSAPTDSVHYLVMEYIDGIGADALVAQHGPLAVADACEIARQAARGLAYIHQHGMVHRDIKPSNLMLTVVPASEYGSGGVTAPAAGGEQAMVKILDLGLALLVDDEQQRLTLMDNRAMGTAMYMSPEQWKTTSVDIRADVYSLGCTLYHLLAGKPPFWESDLRPEKAHEREKLPPIRPEQPLPRGLWDILQRMTAKDPDDRYADPADVAAALAPFAEGQQLARLIRQATRRARHGITDDVAGDETRLTKSHDSDTRPGGRLSSWGLSKSLPPFSRRILGRTAMAVAIVSAVAAMGWLVYLATSSRQSQELARRVRLESLQTAASFASSQILDQINLRFSLLTRLAGDEEVQQRMVQISNSPENESLWETLEDRLGGSKSDADAEAPADSWFINDIRGVQVARSPRSGKSRGENYSHRDYFHGGGEDLEPGTADVAPVRRPHLSSVYRSTTTGQLRVAFSVPIENGRSGDERKVMGVLAMSVDLGEFSVLKRQLPDNHEVVVIDLRKSSIEGVARRGLILHHEARAMLRGDARPRWVGPELMAHIDQALSAAEEGGGAVALPAYRDPDVTGNEPYWGAIKQVIGNREEEAFDTKWLVLVQEPASR